MLVAYETIACSSILAQKCRHKAPILKILSLRSLGQKTQSQQKKKTSALPYLKSTEPGKTSCLDKKKEYLIRKKRDQKNSTITARANTIEADKKMRSKQSNKCYNCQKKSHFAKNCPKSSKN